MYDVLKAILVDDLHLRAGDVLPTTSRAEMGLDSLAAVKLSAALNSRLGITLHDYELLEADTVADVVRLMEERHRAVGSGTANYDRPWSPRAQLRRSRSPVRAPQMRAILDNITPYYPTVDACGRAGPTRLLSLNESPLAPLPGIIEAIMAASGTINRYPDSRCTELTAALARRHGVDSDRVLVGAGSLALLQLLFHAVVESGTEVVYAWRSYELYPVLAELAGAKSVRVPLANDAHDLMAMADRITDVTRMVIVCNPNNPTGTVVGEGELRDFIDRVPPTCLIVLDEAYREYVRKPGVADIRTLCDVYPNVVALRTFSKAYGLAGLRVGYLVGAAPQVVRRLRGAALVCAVNAVAQQAALAALGLEQQILRRVDAVVAERARVRDGLLAGGWWVSDSQGNFLWLSLGADAEAFSRWCARHGIAVRTFAGEGVRVSIGSAEENDAFLTACAGWRADHGPGVRSE